MKKWISRLTKIGFFIFAIIAVILTVMVNMGGNSDTLKFAIEDYISQSTGFAAKIDTFHKMTFYPNISVEAEGIRLKRIDVDAMKTWAEVEQQKPEDMRGKTPPPRIDFDNPDGNIGRLVISMGFWDTGFGGGQKFKDIQIKNMFFKEGSLSHKPITVDAIEIDETPEGKPFLSAKGRFGNDAFEGSLDLEGVGKKKSRKYKIGDESDFQVEIGDLGVEGVLRPRAMGGFHARDIVVWDQKLAAIEATLSFVRDSHKVINLKGAFNIPEHGSNAEIDWKIDTKDKAGMTGTMESIMLNAADFEAGSRLNKTFKKWGDTFLNPDRKTGNSVVDIDVSAETYKDGGREIKPYEGKLSIENNQITLKAVP